MGAEPDLDFNGEDHGENHLAARLLASRRV